MGLARTHRGLHTTRTHVEKFAFGGVAFEVLHPSTGSALQLDDECARFVVRGDELAAEPVAHATCSLTLDPTLTFSFGQGIPNYVRWQRDANDGSLVLDAPRLRARIRPAGHARYVVSCCLEPSAKGAFSFLRSISGALVQLSGGAVFHAVAAEHAGCAVLLMGPSGAGKSTAMSLLHEARCVAFDHVAVAPSQGRWIAWGLPGGSPPPAARHSRSVGLPLAAALRVRHGHAEPDIVDLSGLEAAFALREALESADFSADSQDASLDMVLSLASAISVGEAHTVLGTSWDASLTSWLQRVGT